MSLAGPSLWPPFLRFDAVVPPDAYPCFLKRACKCLPIRKMSVSWSARLQFF